MPEDILRHRIDRDANGLVEIKLNDEERDFANHQGWTDENIETLIHLWSGYSDPLTGKPLELIEFLRRTAHAKRATDSVEITMDTEIVQVVMHGVVLKAVASFLAGRNLLVAPFATDGDDLPTFMVTPR